MNLCKIVAPDSACQPGLISSSLTYNVPIQIQRKLSPEQPLKCISTSTSCVIKRKKKSSRPATPRGSRAKPVVRQKAATKLVQARKPQLEPAQRWNRDQKCRHWNELIAQNSASSRLRHDCLDHRDGLRDGNADAVQSLLREQASIQAHNRLLLLVLFQQSQLRTNIANRWKKSKTHCTPRRPSHRSDLSQTCKKTNRQNRTSRHVNPRPNAAYTIREQPTHKTQQISKQKQPIVTNCQAHQKTQCTSLTTH